MRNFNASTITTLGWETARLFWFLDLEFDSSTYRYSDCDVPLYNSGNKYEPNGFEISNLRINADLSVDRARIDIQNVDLIQSGIILNETIANRTVKIYFGSLDSSNKIIALETMFEGRITSWGGMTTKNCPITVGNYFTFWHKKSLRLAQATCPWAFKSSADPECGYSGSATACNKTWTRCTQLANTLNFGGFRFLPALREKKIWWGMVPGAKIE